MASFIDEPGNDEAFMYCIIYYSIAVDFHLDPDDEDDLDDFDSEETPDICLETFQNIYGS